MDPESPQHTIRLGRGMMIAAWVLLLALLTLFFNGWDKKQRNPNQEVESRITGNGMREVVLKRNRMGHYVANGEINRHKVTFLLDTGATTIAIPQNIADRIGLKRGFPYTVSTANGNITVYATRLESLAIGDIVLHDLKANINPHMQEEGILLGMSVLKQLELIQRGNTLTLRQYP